MQFEYVIITNSNIFYCFKFYKNNEKFVNYTILYRNLFFH